MILQELPASYAADLDRYSSSTRRSSSAVDSGVLSPDALSPGQSIRQTRELPDMMSASEGGGGHGKLDIVREVV